MAKRRIAGFRRVGSRPHAAQGLQLATSSGRPTVSLLRDMARLINRCTAWGRDPTLRKQKAADAAFLPYLCAYFVRNDWSFGALLTIALCSAM